MTREQIYDSQINPLMAEILRICQENKIPMLADFDLSSESNEGLKCTSQLLNPEWRPGSEMLAAAHLLKPYPKEPLMVTLANGNGEKTAYAFL